MNEFDTSLEDLKFRQSEINVKESNKFCPFIKAQCKTNCVCWFSGKIFSGYKYKESKRIPGYYLNPPGCTNALVTKTIQIERS